MNYTLTFNLNHTAAILGISEERLTEILNDLGITPKNGALTVPELEALQQYLTEQVEEADRKTEAARMYLERTVAESAILIDTCSLLSWYLDPFMDHLVPLLRQYQKTLIVPGNVVRELFNLKCKPDTQERAAHAIELICKLREEGLVNIYGSDDKSIADKEILVAAMQYFTETKLTVITYDRKLSEALVGINLQEAVSGKRLNVVQINKFGYLSRYLTENRRQSVSVGRAGTYNRSSDEPVGDYAKLLPVREIPESGSVVTGSSGCMYTLLDVLSSGGEGTIYELHDGSVAKIYHKNKLSEGRRDKLELMVRKSLRRAGLCWPVELLYNSYNEFVGYRMDKAAGIELQRIMLTKQSVEKYFPDWKKQDTVQLSITILEMLDYLHRNGVILGDINLQNLLVVSPTEVWFVDCDSYQVENYPCPVGTVRFTPPELQGKNFGSILRTTGNEAFAVATLLFMIMLPGKSPYAQQGGEGLAEVIRKMDFPYPCGDNNSKFTPMGTYRFQWSHLPRSIKESFYGTFAKGASYSTESTRLTDRDWLREFRKYHTLLAEGKLQENDPNANEIFPNSWKKNPNQQVWHTSVCIDCGKEFDITEEEMTKCLERNFQLPRRCPGCRYMKRILQENSPADAE